MEDSIPTTKLPKRALPPLKKAVSSPTSLIRTPTFRTKRSIALASTSIAIFMICTVVLLLANSETRESPNWVKNVLRVPSYFPDFLFYDDAALFPKKNGRINDTRVSEDAPAKARSQNATIHSEKGDHGKEDLSEGQKKRSVGKSMAKRKEQGWLERMSKCDIYDGKWVKNDLPPLYEPGSCPHIDESFDCHLNGRPDKGYQSYRWQPNHCEIPRLNGRRMLKFLRGKRMVYVGDSLNRNMWESMVCLLRNSVRDKSRVFEASGNNEFKKEGAYSFIFLDYNCSVEYIRSAFLVQEWEIPLKNGSKKETLRLDLVEKSYDTIKDADILVFNTGNWWTHEKTSEGKGYYQEGNHVHAKLDVVEAFQKAMTTWARWIEANIDPRKTHVFFRGYTISHFSKGEWNTGGRCDSKEPVEDEKELLNLDELSPPIPQMIDMSMERVRFPVFYQNVTRMTNYRRDAHPSMFRKPNTTEEEKRDFLTHQDCSHWCLPGVPDTWNELLFAQLLFIHKQRNWMLRQKNSTRLVHP